MRIFWHKLWHWEYWPVYIVYMPTFFLWLFWMLRFRSLKFYQFANTAIMNGGFYGDHKMDIYKLLPDKYYPKTICIKPSETESIYDFISRKPIPFPFIVKPAVGLRGIGVEKVNTDKELLIYALQQKEDFLIQELIEYPNEMGLFYVRMPGEKRGQITGITLKHFLTMEGDGKKSIKQFLNSNPRYAMQIKKLSKQYDLNEVLPLGFKKCLVPFGNHNRGTAFYDGSSYITEKLTNSFNNILDGIEGFHYGRLDIRYDRFKDLEEGRNFSIIELNGAKSEPTHIYDPKHSFWFGQKEIFRHQKMMSRIIGHRMQDIGQRTKDIGRETASL